ncbi:hypothetical protein BGZ54_007297, partial [Gamsiella multidivaricata]
FCLDQIIGLDTGVCKDFPSIDSEGADQILLDCGPLKRMSGDVVEEGTGLSEEWERRLVVIDTLLGECRMDLQLKEGADEDEDEEVDVMSPASRAFPVKIPSDDTVGDLKELIKAKKAAAFNDIDANEITLWHVSILVVAIKNVFLDKIISKEKPFPTTRLSKVFPKDLPEEAIHIIVQRTQPAEKWQGLIEKTEGDFFAPDSANYTSLVRFLKAD